MVTPKKVLKGKVETVMKEYKEGKLHSEKKGPDKRPVVKSKKKKK
jgi:hypothetical protein